jgi:hypothetical protein
MPQTATQIYHRNDLNRQARTFLQDILTPGPQAYQVVHEQAVAQGIWLSDSIGEIFYARQPCLLVSRRYHPANSPLLPHQYVKP